MRVHKLYEIDYAAQTIHVHAVNDDGDPYTENGKEFFMNVVKPIQVSENVITWTVGDGA